MNLRRFCPYLAALLVFTVSLLLPSAASAVRGRPVIAKSSDLHGFRFATFVSDTGTLLRGSRWSTDLDPVVDPVTPTSVDCVTPEYADVQNLKQLGFNALHLFAESPNALPDGYTQPAAGYCLDEAREIANWTRDLDLYLVITIGNGHGKGYNAAFARSFWTQYAQAFRNDTHVVFEVYNEPHVTSNHTYQPSGTELIDFEAEMYNLIRGYAPATPILFFSYGMFRDYQGVIADANALTGRGVNWSNAGIAFHGYADTHIQAGDTEKVLKEVVAAGFPCVMTEHYEWRGGLNQQDVPGTIMLEDRFTSWFTFLTVEMVKNSAKYKDLLDSSGAIWPADFGTWPAKASAPPVGQVVQLQAQANGKWVTASNNGPLTASSTWIGPAESFEVVASERHYVGLKSQLNGKFVTADPFAVPDSAWLVANRDALGLWEQFEWLQRPDGSVALKARVNNKIVAADLNQGNPPPLDANRNIAAAYETFWLYGSGRPPGCCR